MSSTSSTPNCGVLEQVADLVIDLEWPFIVKEIGIESFHSHAILVLQMTTDDYVTCPQIDPLLRRKARSMRHDRAPDHVHNKHVRMPVHFSARSRLTRVGGRPATPASSRGLQRRAPVARG